MHINQLNTIETKAITNISRSTGALHQTAENNVVSDVVSCNIKTVSSIAQNYDVTNISPKEMAEMSQQLFDSGNITLKQHSMLSFQPELNPSYSSTIGKMTNKIGQPDVPRNFLGEWKDLLEHQIKNGYPEHIIQNTKEVVFILDNFKTLRSSLVS